MSGELQMDYSDRRSLQQLFVDNLRDCALVVLDVEGKVLTWNAGATAMLGYTESEMIGRHFSCLYMQRDVDAGKPVAALADALAQGCHDDTGQRRHKDGRRVATQGMLIPLYDSDRKLVAFGNLTREMGIAPRSASIASAEVRKKILLVDDDAAVRNAAVDLLGSLGYEVLVASSGDEALDMLTRIDDIDVLFTDVVMPGGMGGGEVAEKAQALRPDLKFLFASGYFEPALVREGTIAARTHFLVKPYRKKELALKMEQVLGATVAPRLAAR
jgi:PAS domain S-box-containing protein